MYLIKKNAILLAEEISIWKRVFLSFSFHDPKARFQRTPLVLVKPSDNLYRKISWDEGCSRIEMIASEWNHWSCLKISTLLYDRTVNLDYRDYVRELITRWIRFYLIERIEHARNPRETQDGSGATVGKLMKRILPFETHDSHCTEARDANRKKLASR